VTQFSIAAIGDETRGCRQGRQYICNLCNLP